MIQWVEYVWWLSFSILMGYHLIVFRIRPQRHSELTQDELPGVSIVIAVRNGSKSILQNLDVFLSQDYPHYEIIIVNDHSAPEEKQMLEVALNGHSKITLLHSDSRPGKKYALTLGIEKAIHPIILCTDADCCPAGNGWITSMVSQSKFEAVVVGYSPYRKKAGILNLFIRFETVMTAIQYFSWTLVGRPYMGVGRNLLYARDLFLELNPYKEHESIPYGDDDLLIQKAAVISNVNVNLDNASFTFSDAPTSWRSWFNQKHRHMSAGHHYRISHWWKPGVYGIALIMHWIFVPIVLWCQLQSDLMNYMIGGLLIRWISYIQWTQRLGDKDTRLWYPLAEVAYALYLAVMGLRTIIAKKKTWN